MRKSRFDKFYLQMKQENKIVMPFKRFGNASKSLNLKDMLGDPIKPLGKTDHFLFFVLKLN